MKKLLIALVAVALLSVGVFGFAYAQTTTPTPAAPGTTGTTTTPFQGRQGKGPEFDGVLQDYMTAALAAKLGYTVDDFKAQLTAGKTVWQLGEAKGLTMEQYRVALTDANTAAIDAALKDGKLTDVQAQALKDRAAQMPFNGGMLGMGKGGEHGLKLNADGTPVQPPAGAPEDFGHRGGPGGRGERGGMGKGAPQTQITQPTPTTQP